MSAVLTRAKLRCTARHLCEQVSECTCKRTRRGVLEAIDRSFERLSEIRCIPSSDCMQRRQSLSPHSLLARTLSVYRSIGGSVRAE